VTAVLAEPSTAPRNARDADTVVRLLRAQGVPAGRILVGVAGFGSEGLAWVQVRCGWGDRPSGVARQLLTDVGAEHIAVDAETQGREWSGVTPDGTWIYIPSRPLTPFPGRGADNTEGDPR
jgi:hypothetical protein